MALTLRRTLLLAFLLLGILPSVVLSWLSFSRTRSAMEAKIAQGLNVQAQSLQADIDTMLFERFQNVLVWSRSELMQDLRFGDVDKRVTSYLVGLADGYGDVYQRLQCRSTDGVVLASSMASDIGQRVPADDPRQLSAIARLPGGQARLYLPPSGTLNDRLPIWIDTDLAAGDAPAGTAGAQLRLAFNPAQLSRLLDNAALGGRQVVVLDAQGRWVAGSRGLRGLALPDAAQRQAGLAVAASGATRVDSGRPWSAAPMLIGRGPSRATRAFGGSGWTTLVLQPVDEALAPVGSIARTFLVLLLAVLLATLAAATLAASMIERPIAALTETAVRYQREGRLPTTPNVASRITELDELGRAYLAMIRSVEHSRRELVRSSKLAMLGEFSAVLAHEVRTPLGILRSSAQVLLRDPGLSADSRELMGFIESETERLNRLVSTMLDTARPRRPQFGPCDLHELLRRCIQMRSVQPSDAPASAPITLHLEAADPRLDADAEQLMQTLFNLLSNAQQAAGPTGHVVLSTADAGDWLQLRCEDDGPGIAPAVAERLFDPFVSGREGGIGLGLAVVRQIVDAHGGQISVGRSALGGALFTLHLPRHPPAPLLETARA